MMKGHKTSNLHKVPLHSESISSCVQPLSVSVILLARTFLF